MHGIRSVWASYHARGHQAVIVGGNLVKVRDYKTGHVYLVDVEGRVVTPRRLARWRNWREQVNERQVKQ